MQLANGALSWNFADANTLPQYPFYAYLGDPFKLKWVEAFLIATI